MGLPALAVGRTSYGVSILYAVIVASIALKRRRLVL